MKSTSLNKVLGAVCAGLFSLCLASTASAGTIKVAFTAEDGYSGEFLYNSAAPVATPAGIPYFHVGTSYQAISFTINSIAQTGHFWVELYDNFNTGFDYVYFTGEFASGPLIQLKGDNSVLGGVGLAQLTGMDLSDWASNPDGTNDLYTGNYTGQNGANTFNLTSLNISAVPLPAAAWLFGSALIGLVAVARRKAVV